MPLNERKVSKINSELKNLGIIYMIHFPETEKVSDYILFSK